MRLAAGLIALGLAPALAAPAAAGDGSWTQVDAWAGGIQWVTNIERGRWVWGMAGGRDEGELWGRASVLRSWKLGPEARPWTLRAGLAAKAEQQPRWDLEDRDYHLSHCLPADPDRCLGVTLGVKLAADRWSEHGPWGLFLMGEWSRIDNAKLAVMGLTHLPSGTGGQLSVWHESGGEITPTVMVRSRWASGCRSVPATSSSRTKPSSASASRPTERRA